MKRLTLRGSLAVYAALAVGPAATVLPGPTWPLFGLGAVATAAIATAVTRRITAATVLETPWLLGGFLVPLGWLVPLFLSAPEGVSLLISPWFMGALASVGWIATTVIAHEIRRQERRRNATELCTFEARHPPGTRRQLRIAVGALMVTGVAVLGVLLSVDTAATVTGVVFVLVMMPLWTFLLVDENGRTVAVTDAGLYVQGTPHDWETIERYELTDDAIVLHRDAWHRLRMEFDRGDIDDEASVRDALDTSLSA